MMEAEGDTVRAAIAAEADENASTEGTVRLVVTYGDEQLHASQQVMQERGWRLMEISRGDDEPLTRISGRRVSLWRRGPLLATLPDPAAGTRADADLAQLSEPTWYEDTGPQPGMVLPCLQRDAAITLAKRARDERDEAVAAINQFLGILRVQPNTEGYRWFIWSVDFNNAVSDWLRGSDATDVHGEAYVAALRRMDAAVAAVTPEQPVEPAGDRPGGRGIL